MANILKIVDAVEIIRAPGLHDSAEILSAVELVKGNLAYFPELKEQLDSFYNTYYEIRTEFERDGKYNDHEIAMRIFSSHDEYHDEYVRRAVETSQKLADAAKKKIDITDFSFAELDALQSKVRALGINGQKPKTYEQATLKLNQAMEYKLQHISAHTTLKAEEAEAAEHFVDNIEDKVTQKKLADLLDKKVVSDYDEENNLLDKPDDMLARDEQADSGIESIRLFDDEGQVHKDFAEIKDIVKNITIVDDDGKKVENPNEHIEALFNAAKVDAHQEAIREEKFSALKAEDKKVYLVEQVRDAFLMKIGQASVASTIERPDEKDLENDDTFEAYLQRRDDAASKVVEKIVNNKTPVKFKSSQAEMAVIDTELEAEKFVSRLDRKLGDKKTKLSVRIQQLSAFAKKMWGNRHAVKKAVVKNIKDNKAMHITNLAMTGVMLGGMALAPLTGGASAIAGISAYSAYTAGSGYLWPLRAERQKLQAEAKTKGKKLGYLAAIKQAFKNKKDDPAYKARRRWGLVGAGASAALGFIGMGNFFSNLAATKVAMGRVNTLLAGLAATRSSRAMAGAARAVAGVGAQGSMLAEAKKAVAMNDTPENRSKLKAAKCFFGISLLGAGVASYFMGKSLDGNVALNEALQQASAGGNTGGDFTFGGARKDVSDCMGMGDVDINVSEFGGPKIPVDVDAFNADEKSMFLHSLKHFDGGKETVETCYDAFRKGMVESLPTFPDGSSMSPAQYVDAMSRLQEFSAHPEAVKLMYRELNCENFNPSYEQKQIIADALKDISYEHSKMKVAIMNDCGELEIKEVSRWGQYTGKQKMVEAVVDGHKKLIPLRNANRSFGIGAAVDCADGKVTIHGRVKYGSLPCDKRLVEITPPAPQKVNPQVEIIPEIDCDDIPNAGMAENTTGYQTSGQYTSPINVNVNRNTGHYLVDGDSVAANELMQKARQEFASAGMTEESNLGKLPGVLRATKDKVIIYLDEGSITPAGKDIPVSCNNGQPVEFEMKRDDYLAYLKTGEMPSRTKSVPLTDENYQNILFDEQFAYKGDKGDRSNFTTSVEGAEYFSMPKPVDFSGDVSQLGIEQGGKIASVTMSTSSGPVDVFVNTETGDITAKLGDKPVRFSPETQEKAAAALAERLSSRYDVADLSLAAPEGTLAKKAEMAMQGQSYVPSRDQLAQNVHATGSANIRPLWQAHQGQLRA